MDRPLRVVFFILMHKNPQQAIRLIERLDSPTSTFIVHVDRRSADTISRPIEEFAAARCHVHCAPRQPCYWAGFGIVLATLECMRTALQLAEPFDYAVLLSGQDYPIKPPQKIFAHLRAQRGKQLIESFRLDQPNRWSADQKAGGAMHRIGWYHLAIRSHWVHVPIERRLPAGLLPFGGAQWWCLTRDCLGDIVAFVDGNPQVLKFFRNVFISDEVFFQTLISNSRFAGDITGEDLHYVDWTRPNPLAPRLLEASDFERLCASEKLFARKFDAARDARILDRIDREILFVRSDHSAAQRAGDDRPSVRRVMA